MSSRSDSLSTTSCPCARKTTCTELVVPVVSVERELLSTLCCPRTLASLKSSRNITAPRLRNCPKISNKCPCEQVDSCREVRGPDRLTTTLGYTNVKRQTS